MSSKVTWGFLCFYRRKIMAAEVSRKIQLFLLIPTFQYCWNGAVHLNCIHPSALFFFFFFSSNVVSRQTLFNPTLWKLACYCSTRAKRKRWIRDVLENNTKVEKKNKKNRLVIKKNNNPKILYYVKIVTICSKIHQAFPFLCVHKVHWVQCSFCERFV